MAFVGAVVAPAASPARKQVVQFATHYRAHLWADLWLKRKRSLIFGSFPTVRSDMEIGKIGNVAKIVQIGLKPTSEYMIRS